MPRISGPKLEFLEPYPAHHVASFHTHTAFIASQIIGTWEKTQLSGHHAYWRNMPTSLEMT
jgi:hypothetical protein